MTNAPSISQCVATQVRAYRRRQDMTLNQLADKCADLGAAQLSFSALANIERGATAESKRKPREVSLDELAVLARALNVPPVMLMFPIGTMEQVQVLPGEAMATWNGAQWFTGEALLTADVEEHFATPIYLFREHEHHVQNLLMREWADSPDRREAGERTVQSIRAEIRRHGLTPPSLPPELAQLDQPRGGAHLSATATLTAGGKVIPPKNDD